jgi:phage gpG-like protein
MIKIVKNTAKDVIAAFTESLTDKLDLNRSIANIALGDISDHFRDEMDSSGTRWPPLARITIEKRRKGPGSGSPKPLLDTGQLFQSLNIGETNANEAIVSANKYDAYFGINVAELQNEGGRGKILEEDGSVTEINVPPREFMWVSKGAMTEIEALASEIAKEAMKQA